MEPALKVSNNRVTILMPRAWTGWIEISSACNLTARLPEEHFAVFEDVNNYQTLMLRRNSLPLEVKTSTTMSNLFGGDTSKAMGLSKMTKASPPTQSSETPHLASGCMQVVTPCERIELVCASRKPLCAPTLEVNGFDTAGSCPREENDESAELFFESMVDEKSTSEPVSYTHLTLPTTPYV